MYVAALGLQPWLLTILLATTASATKYMTVTEGSCGTTTEVNGDDDIMVSYEGTRALYNSCKLMFMSKDLVHQICVQAVTINMPCSLRLTYNSAIYSKSMPDKEIGCKTYYSDEWCTSFDKVIVTFENDDPSIPVQITNVVFKVYANDFTPDITETVQTAVYVTIGVVVGSVILFGLCIVIVICCVCKKCGEGRRSTGTVYRSPQQATAVTVNQPAPPQPTAGYPQQQAGYQPPPVNYQQPPPTAYGPGYQPPQQGYYAGSPGYPPAGNQQPAQQYPPQENLPEKSVQPSAPPSEYPMQDLPPPYPGK